LKCWYLEEALAFEKLKKHLWTLARGIFPTRFLKTIIKSIETHVPGTGHVLRLIMPFENYGIKTDWGGGGVVKATLELWN